MATSLPEIEIRTKPESDAKTKTRRVPPYNVLLENDDHHSMEFVMDVLQKTLGCATERAFQFMMQAHTSGRSVVWTGPKEVAELKVDQIRTFHEHRPGGVSLGPLSCAIEPAPGS